MRSTAVIGLGFGDEGKGNIVNALCAKYKNGGDNVIVNRFSGGHQAGHTVVYNGIRHTFSNFGSGTLAGVPTIWGKNCTFDPPGFLEERFDLTTKLLGQPLPDFFIDPSCPVVTPFDKMANTSNKANIAHGTCGVGFGTTLQRESNHYHLFAMDLFFGDKTIKTKLSNIADYYHFQVPSKIIDGFIKICGEVSHYLKIYRSKVFDNYSRVIFEGSQGLLLDKKYGFFPYVTRADLTPPLADNYYLVTRGYQTRHGNGPMTNLDCFDESFVVNNPEECNRPNEYQGEFRVSPLDLDLIKYSCLAFIAECPYPDSDVSICITCLDQMDTYLVSENENMLKFNKRDSFLAYMSKTLCVDAVIAVDRPDFLF